MRGRLVRRQLAQLEPSVTTAVSLFSPSGHYEYSVDLILAANTSGAKVDVTIYHDVTGSTFDDTTTVLSTQTLNSGETLDFTPGDGFGLSDYRQDGNVGVKTSVANAVTFTAYGTVFGEQI